MSPSTSSGSFVKSNWFSTNTALHAGRNFAVAIQHHYWPHLVQGEPLDKSLCLSTLASLFASLCSRTTGVTSDALSRSEPLIFPDVASGNVGAATPDHRKRGSGEHSLGNVLALLFL